MPIRGEKAPGDTTPLRRFLNALPRPLRRQKLLLALSRFGLVDSVQYLGFNEGGRAWVDLRDAESRASYLSQSFWPEFHPIVAAFLGGGGALFDVGANFGLVTFGVVPLIAGRGVDFHLFEANPRIIPILERSAALWPGERIVVQHGCVTDRPGVSRLTLPSHAWGQAFIGESGEPIPNLVLDDYISERRIERIAFLKMDIEGWEPNALKGAERALAAGVVEAGFIEVSPELLRRAGSTAEALLGSLRGLGFDAYLCGLWEAPVPDGLAWTRVPVHGMPLLFASATPLPASFAAGRAGDVLILHRSTPLSVVVREAVAAEQG